MRPFPFRAPTILVVVGMFLAGWLILESADPSSSGPGAVQAAQKQKTKSKAKAPAAVHHTHVKSDLKKLRAIKKDLASVPLHYGGHRDRALKSIDHAINELQTLLKNAALIKKGMKK